MENQLYIGSQPVWYGYISGGYGNNNGYKILVGPKPDNEILREQKTSWSQETAVTLEWSPCSASFFDTPGRKQILFQATVEGAEKAGLSTVGLSRRVSMSLFKYSDIDKKKAIRRKLEDRIRKDEHFLMQVLTTLADDLL